MAWNLSQGWANAKPISVAVYTTLIIGILFSAAYVISSLYSGKPVFYLGSVSSLAILNDSLQKNHSINDSQLATENIPLTHSVPSAPQSKIWEPPPAGTKMPSSKEFRLTKEMVESRAKDNIIIVTFGNYAFMDFILNWVRHLTDLGVFNLLVGAMDEKLLEALYSKGIPVFYMGSNMDTIDVGWGSPAFHKMGREKVILIDAILPFGYELLMCDTDMVWLKNPLPYFARFPEADILTSSDQVIPTVTDDGLEVWQKVTGAYNIGIFHWRPTYSSKKLVKAWKDVVLADEKIWDQTAFNDLTRKILGPSVDEESGLVYSFDGNLKLGILPASIFCNGHTYFVQAMHEQLKLRPYAVHTTFQYAGTKGKRHRLREGMLFYDPTEYYDSPGGFLSFKTSIPESLLLGGQHTVESHFNLVNHQLKQIRMALSVALLLNRTLVMPPLWCRLDRLWFGHPGVLEGTLTRQPFICPLDHVFEVNVMLDQLPKEEFGSGIDFREYSFLDNPLLPKKVKESVLEVQLCDNRLPHCQIANETSHLGMVNVPKHGTEEMFLSALAPYKDTKVIYFSSMVDAFQGFTDKDREAKFRRRVKRYVGLWCCVQNRHPGHIYYDMYWDEKPNWKPVPPSTPEDDHPPW